MKSFQVMSHCHASDGGSNVGTSHLKRMLGQGMGGTLKAWMGPTHFATRGLKNVGAEFALNVLAYNIKRMINMIGIGPLIKAITA